VWGVSRLVAGGGAPRVATHPRRGLRAISVTHERDEIPSLAPEDMPAPPPVIKTLSPQYLRHYVACPVAVEGSTVTVAAADPTDPLLLDDLRQFLGAGVQLCRAPADAILEAIGRAYDGGS